MSQSLLGAGTPPDTSAGGGHRMLGWDVQFAAAGTVVGYRWYGLTGGLQTAVTGCLFLRSTQVLLDSAAFGAIGVGWNEVVTSVAVSVGTTYTLAAAIDGGDLPLDSDGLLSAVAVGDITALVGTGRFLNFGTGVQYPTSGPGDYLFHVDLLFDPAPDETATGPRDVATAPAGRSTCVTAPAYDASTTPAGRAAL